MTAVFVNDLSICCALGNTASEVTNAFLSIDQAAASPLVFSDAYSPGKQVPLGICDVHLPQLPAGNETFDCRNNQLLWKLYGDIEQTLNTLVGSNGESRSASGNWARVGIVLGTSTSGIQQAEIATHARIKDGTLPKDFHFTQQQLSGGGDFLLENTPIKGPSFTVSTACSSSGHALASAKRLIEMDLCDVVLAGGVDTLCQFTVQGFGALEAVSTERTNPFSVNRRGINLGEGGALFVLSKYPDEVRLLGTGASTDAHHISAPHPQGRGALAAMTSALRDAGIDAADVDYINLHGTGTGQNDSAEAMAVNHLFGADVMCSSTKPLTGHTLGAAGIIEAALCTLMLSQQNNPERTVLPHIYDGEFDGEINPVKLAIPAEAGQQMKNLAICLSNSFAFGGNNAAIIFALSAT